MKRKVVKATASATVSPECELELITNPDGSVTIRCVNCGNCDECILRSKTTPEHIIEVWCECDPGLTGAKGATTKAKARRKTSARKPRS